MDVFILPQTCSKLMPIKLPNPKVPKNLQSFFYDEDNLALYEAVKFEDNYRSWFFDNDFCQKGHMNFLTRVDPLFIFLPHVIKYSSQQFRSIEDICATFASEHNAGNSSTSTSNSNSSSCSRLDFALSPDIDWSKICQTKELEGEMFIRYCEENTINWLLKKHARLTETLQTGVLQKSASKATVNSYATDLIGQYLPSELSVKFKNKVSAVS